MRFPDVQSSGRVQRDQLRPAIAINVDRRELNRMVGSTKRREHTRLREPDDNTGRLHLSAIKFSITVEIGTDLLIGKTGARPEQRAHQQCKPGETYKGSFGPHRRGLRVYANRLKLRQ
jgi:hypothetical protein